MVLAVAMVATALNADISKNTVTPDSRPCPQWWKDAKFGVFVHWGVYSVPAFAPTSGDKFYSCYAEHYAGRVMNGVKAFVDYHQKMYHLVIRLFQIHIL